MDIYMEHFKARQHFQVSSGKIDFFAEASAKKVCSFILKEKMYFSDQGTDYLEIHWFPYIGQFGHNFGTYNFETYGNQCIFR